MIEKIYQQGDVILKKRQKLPKEAKEVFNDGIAVLAEGEATGHAHVMPGTKVALYEIGEDKWVDVKEAAPMTHQEHAVQIIAPGLYELWQVREVDPFAEEVRKVVD